MTKPKYASATERRAALSAKAKQQMLDQWERQRAESGQEGPGYFGCHMRVRKTRGPAKNQRCADCGARARHWAHIHETDPADPRNYQAMCISCHRTYDQVRAQQIETLGPEGRTAAAKLAWSRRTPEERRAIALRAWETKRRKQGQPYVAPDPALARAYDGEPE